MPGLSHHRRPSGAVLGADVLVIGGGLVGGVLSVALAGAGLEVAVVDREDPARTMKTGFDGRASAVALGSQRMLAGLDLWSALAPHAGPIREIQVREGESRRGLRFDHLAVGAGPLGYMVENQAIRRALLDRLPALANLRHLAPAGVARLERRASGIEAQLEDGRRISAPLAIGADGRASPTRACAGIRVTRWSYRQSGIVCTVAHERPHNAVAFERFLPAGPFAILPLPGNRSSIVWTERVEMTPAIMALEASAFLGELGKRFGRHLGQLRVVSPRWAYPLSLQFAESMIAERLALVGDAAHGMHPLAGQGLNMGWRDAAALAEVVVDAHRMGGDTGAEAVLARYQRWRRFDTTIMLAVTDGLNRLFSNNIRPLRLIRDAGLALVDCAPLLKRIFILQATGVLGDLPRLLRGRPL